MFWPSREKVDLLSRRIDIMLDTAEAMRLRLDRLAERPPPVIDLTETQGRLSHFEGELSILNARIKELTLAIAEGIEKTDRAEKRVRQVVTRARKELAAHDLEDPALEGEAQELRLVDGDGGEELPEVPRPLADDPSFPSSVRGVSREQLLRARGLI